MSLELTQETLAEISEELRSLSTSAKYCELQPTVFGKPIALYLVELADRIDVAKNTSSNAAALRAALMQVSLSCSACPRHNCKGCTRPFASFMPAVRKALSVSARNCDVVPVEAPEAADVFHSERPGHGYDYETHDWLLAPAAKRKGEGDA